MISGGYGKPRAKRAPHSAVASERLGEQSSFAFDPLGKPQADGVWLPVCDARAKRAVRWASTSASVMSGRGSSSERRMRARIDAMAGSIESIWLGRMSFVSSAKSDKKPPTAKMARSSWPHTFLLFFKVPDRGSVNPTPLGGMGKRHYRCIVEGWKHISEAVTRSGTANIIWYG